MTMTFSATEARAKFFHILKLAERGIPVIIVKKDTNTQFNVRVKKKDSKSNKMAILKQLSHLGLKSGTPEEINQILESRLAS